MGGFDAGYFLCSTMRPECRRNGAGPAFSLMAGLPVRFGENAIVWRFQMMPSVRASWVRSGID